MADIFESWVAWMTAAMASGDPESLRCCLDAVEAAHNEEYSLDVQAEALRRIASGVAPVGLVGSDEAWLDFGGEA